MELIVALSLTNATKIVVWYKVYENHSIIIYPSYIKTEQLWKISIDRKQNKTVLTNGLIALALMNFKYVVLSL